MFGPIVSGGSLEPSLAVDVHEIGERAPPDDRLLDSVQTNCANAQMPRQGRANAIRTTPLASPSRKISSGSSWYEDERWKLFPALGMAFHRDEASLAYGNLMPLRWRELTPSRLRWPARPTLMLGSLLPVGRALGRRL
eukprot:9481521-Pyramimonas_sp.AAC.1